MIENTPDIRFKNFSDNWKGKELSDVLHRYDDPVEIPHNGYDRLGIRSHAKGTFHEYVPAGKELQTAKMNRVASDKFIVNITFGWEHAVAVTTQEDAGKLVSHRFPQFSMTNELHPQFLKYIILDASFRQHLLLSSPGGAGRNRVLKINEMLQYGISIPSIEEQKKIAETLATIDNLISSQQNKVNTLINTKKAMLVKMFPKEGETEPEIRFAGFTGAWEQRKFGELCLIVTKQTGFDYTATIKKSLLTEESEDTLPYLQTKNFTGMSIDYKTDYYIPKSVAKEFPKINLDEKCLLFSIVGASVGNIGFFPGDKHCFLSGAICVSKLQNQNDADFLYHYMCSECGQSQIRTCTKGGAQATITIEDIRDFNVLLPSEDERMKIGNLLTNIDNTITLHQRKLDKLKDVKKAMLNKMFT